MRRLLTCIMVSSALSVACSGSDDNGGSSGGGAGGDAAGSGGTAGSGGSDSTGGTSGSGGSSGSGGTLSDGGSGGAGGTGTTAACGPAASVNADGVLTPYPNIHYSIQPAGFTLVSANFIATNDGDPRGPLLELFAEVRNDSLNTECYFLPSVYLEVNEIVGLVEAAPFYSQYLDTVTEDCIAPGESGVLNGAARGITEADLAAAATLTIDLAPDTIGTFAPATVDEPTLTTSIDGTADGWILSGNATMPTTIHNYGIRVYPIDQRGLIIDELLAFPNDLGTLAGGTTVPFATDAASCSFGDYLLFQSWIVGPAQ